MDSTTDTGCSDSYNSYGKSHSSDTSLSYGSDINAISVDLGNGDNISCSGLNYLPTWPAINLEFRDLSYEVYDVHTKARKPLLRGINGQFRAHELTAILGPSGAGKTTLLNLLAGYGARKTSGEICVNHSPRDMRVFRKMSRYIMQNDVLDPHFTVLEAMLLAAHLKLGNDLSHAQKLEVIDEILRMLGLKKVQNTITLRLSGGEKKRLCIALELVNNPPVIFLDEPTTGLDDISSSQCISLLRGIAHRTGRTVICSVHTPSAKVFDMFDKVYILAKGQCIYQGSGANIVPYMKHIGLTCPRTYNPADFIIEVACQEYGTHYHEPMVEAVENGKVYRWTPHREHRQIKADATNKSDTTSGASSFDELEQFEEEINPKLLKQKASWWMQYKLLLARMMVQMWRDKSYIKLRFYMNIVLALIIGSIYRGVGDDASKAFFNFGFAFTIIIAYLYLPMMPVLLQFPTEMKFLKREYFNQWYHLSSYYAAMISSKLPFMFVLAVIYLIMVYIMSSQPLELFRFCMLFLIAFLTAMTSESLGLLISSHLSLVNAMFMGPVVAVPLILLSCYGIGYGKAVYIHPLMRYLMQLSYLRHGMEGLVAALYGYDREDLHCPETEVFCMFKKSKFLLMILGFENLNYVFSVACLVLFYIIFTLAAYFMIRQRLSLRTSNNVIVQYAKQFLVKHLNFSSYNY
ncbi:ATP-binding cassette sub-family G member 1 [Bactrocera tryoni]|uniref:ATP-binding cassette sub-family G member 1 n=1 Tax=Bactrocera tryoni TaxID=59916 RepID=UPI001A96B15D|nr:ATP-binding cassette sub-family G member 1 [Bactrocera tryoni]XP_039950238.1 ATP-binding cassette sub-family G member 1 [Bactrocera tryoni]XP_039950239.1 ATP-binding cassette sub-family G member 1 [Bactrocera tryoni]